ncbi:hypothetical protein THRCLA_02134 [Thraustotheca clavata]|uniref:Ankyrin repeat-containing domain n=1 Tax=Thraustotheca clavata TaxID=74557 RepID=A0A1W0A6A6_9STRA|nr:hypothetical protein THRCLA_02134 [Thraustotheca clavata]
MSLNVQGVCGDGVMCMEGALVMSFGFVAKKMDSTWVPIELEAIILAMAGPLTQFLHRSNDDDIMNESTKAEVWKDVFRFNWDGDFNQLPATNLDSSCFRLINNKAMYERMKEYLNNDEQEEYTYVAYMNEYFENDAYAMVREDIKVTELLAAPMENVWLEELQEEMKYPIALAHAAVAGGHVALLQYLVHENDIEIDRLYYFHSPHMGFAMDIVAHFGHLNMLKFLHDAGSMACSNEAMDSAAAQGHIHIVKWLHANRTEGCTSRAFDDAINNGHTDVVAYLGQSRTEGFSANAIDYAAAYDRFDIVKYLHEECNAPCTTAAMDAAACGGFLDIVEYLHENRQEGCTTSAMDGAASSGHLYVVEFLHKNRSEGCTTFALDHAAMNNHLAVVQFLHENRQEGGTTRALDRAAHRGLDDMVHFLHENRHEGCTTRAIDWAAARGHLNIVQFLIAHRQEGFTFRALYWAAREGHLGVLSFLLTQDNALQLAKQAVDRALSDGHRSVFETLRSAGCPGTSLVDMDIIAWDEDVDGCYTFQNDRSQNGEEAYYDWDSDTSIN